MLQGTKEKVKWVKYLSSSNLKEKLNGSTMMKGFFKKLVLFHFMLLFNISFAQIKYNEIDYGIHPMEYSPVGTVGFQYLNLFTNARSAAMGGVISAIGYGDANSSFMNPASLTDVQNINLSFNQMKWVADIDYNTISMVKKFSRIGTLGFHMIYVNYGDEPRTEYREEVTPTEIVYVPVLDELGTVDASDLAIGISYARQITEKLHFGTNLRFLEERIDDAKTHTWAIDVGTVFYTGFKSLRISMLGKNFGPDAEFRKFSNRIQMVPFSIKLPMQLWIGSAIDLLESTRQNQHRLTLMLDYVVRNDGKDKLNLGTEFSFQDILILRTGYRFQNDEGKYTLGGGIKYETGGLQINIDYAYIDTGIFNGVNMFSFNIKM